MGKEWNRRFVMYAEAYGRSPEDQLAYDKEAWPGGTMVGFKLWMMPLIREFKAQYGSTGSVAYDCAIIRRQDEFDTFLQEKANDGVRIPE